MEPDLINPELNVDELFQRLNGETAKLCWKELEPYFARGVVVRVTPELDLVEVAISFIRDEHTQVEGLMESGSVARATDSEAIEWAATGLTFWAVVVAPWVLIQQVSPAI